MRYAGKLPQSIEISNNEDWVDGLDFRKADGVTPADPIPAGSIKISMRRSAKESTDADLIFDQAWLVYSANTVTWEVPKASMNTLVADEYDLEIISDTTFRRVTIRGKVCVLQGILPV